MIFVSLARWSQKSGALFIHKRIYWNGGTWTPFCRLFWRYCTRESDSRPLAIGDTKEHVDPLSLVPPDIDYVPLHEFAHRHAVDYNDLCKAVHAAVDMQ